MENVLVAVSGGSDSLALVDLILKEKKYTPIVCHVNYNYRDSSFRDEKIVRSYCEKNKIKFHLLNLDSRKEKEGNFENWARVKRYKFFKEIYDSEGCKYLFVGHHKDDVIETYYLQIQRHATVEWYGLKKETNIQGMNVVRPLLNYSKKDLEKYCLENDIEYGVDETNFDLRYTRNKIRHEIVANMSEKEKNDVIRKIKELNEALKEKQQKIKKAYDKCVTSKNCIDIEKFNDNDENTKTEIIYYFLINNIYEKISIKKSRIKDIITKINSDKPNIILAEYKEHVLYKEYKFLVIEKNESDYTYKIDDDLNLDINQKFKICSTGKKLEKVEALKDEFPLYLKKYDGKNKSINRIFINKKIPLKNRKNWPVIVNKFGELLLVIGIKKFYNKMRDLNENLIEFYVCENKGE